MSCSASTVSSVLVTAGSTSDPSVSFVNCQSHTRQLGYYQYELNNATLDFKMCYITFQKIVWHERRDAYRMQSAKMKNHSVYTAKYNAKNLLLIRVCISYSVASHFHTHSAQLVAAVIWTHVKIFLAFYAKPQYYKLDPVRTASFLMRGGRAGESLSILHQYIRRLMALAHLTLHQKAREVIACDYFIDATPWVMPNSH